MLDDVKTRTRWEDLPAGLRAESERILCAPISSATSQAGGFSPGSADRLVAANGRRAFVKAIQRDHNPGAFELHARELVVMAALPATVDAPRLLGSWRDDDTIGLIIEDIDGRHPGEPADGRDLVAILDAFATLPVVTGTALEALPRAADEFVSERDSWKALAADSAGADLPNWVVASFDRLADAASGVCEAVDGEHLLHLDVRADNVIIDPSGRAWLIDWPWAAVGARWVDGVPYLLDARLRGEPIDAEELLRTHPLFAETTDAQVDAMLAGIVGRWFDQARLPAPPSMPTLRAFQRSEALAGVAWLTERWG
ncbi:hypothetical protein ACW5CM_09860 [Microbacterium sp. A588]